MRSGFIILALPFIMTGSFLSGCATAPDPAEICTTEWIKPRTERAVEDITKSSSSAIKALKRLGETYAAGKTPGMLQMLSLSNSMKSLEKQVKNGRGIRDLKTLAKTCNDPTIVTETLTTFMSDQGLPANMIKFVTQLPIYQSLIADIMTTEDGPQS